MRTTIIASLLLALSGSVVAVTVAMRSPAPDMQKEASAFLSEAAKH